tara:strand:- start:7 stop:717 length:711 start_codon:yes stop_codon:yes gene_type:complete
MGYVGNKPAQTTIPVDDSVTTAMLKDDAVTADKVANAINTSIAANTAKVTNATHTGDVTGATALTIAADAVDIAMLSATGTASSSTFLRGDNTWTAIASADNTPAFQMTNTSDQSFSAGSYGTLDFNQTDWDTDSGCDLTNNKYVVPSGEGGKYLIYGYFNPTSLSGSSVYIRIKVNTTEIGLWTASAGNDGHHRHHPIIVYNLSAGDEIIWQLYVDNVSTTTGAQSGGGFKLAGV